MTKFVINQYIYKKFSIMEFKGSKEEFISLDRLREVLVFDYDKGVFIWKKSTGRRNKLGNKAGWVDTSTGYENIKIDGKKYKSHTLAWFYCFEEIVKNLDHINHNKLDNRISNLRFVSHIENCKNKQLSKNNSSGVCGVSFHSKNKRWVSFIKVDGKHIHLGSFENKDEAINCRKNAEIKYNFHKNHGTTTNQRSD